MIATLIALAFIGEPSAQPADAWRACVLKASEKWSQNNETADVIAEGAIGICQPQEPREATASPEIMKRMKQQAIAVVLDKRRP